jgi:pyroglutamyl-peptidase
MPVVPTAALDNVDRDAYRVLVTGFGPFAHYKENPSWLAVQPLHNRILTFDRPATPAVDDDVIMNGTDESEASSKTSQIHITTCKIPTTYEAVLSIVPSFHARPPVLPESQDPHYPNLAPPEDGFDLCFHVGVAGRGPLRVERVGHKKGYNMKDVSGKLAPIVPVSISTEEAGPAAGASDPAPPSEVQRAEMERLGYDPFGRLEDPVDGGDIPTRGLGKGYEAFDDEIHTDIDALKLVHFLKETGFEDIYTSMDAGHYLCDYIYYCSLAEAKRANRNEVGKNTKVLFLHCPPVNQPHSTQEVSDAIMKAVTWICTGLQSGEALSTMVEHGGTN